ncbi:MAG: hypothetical protein KatS3mg057_2373 [Herpetosiphonaceae bacterium]|nr:MAG: hypothetical protein KatS3mg057_2373 [Herpetosiphonaceae bacterium]
MNELINRLKTQAQLSDEQANRAADVVRNFLNERLPEQLQGPVNAALSGQNVQTAAEKAHGFLGGFMGEKER